MMEEGMGFVGDVRVSGNVPCVKCEQGDTCRMSGIKMLYGSEATISSVGVKSFEDQPVALDAAAKPGKEIARRLRNKSTSENTFPPHNC